MLGTIILATIAFLLLASIHDWKTREVPDFLNYSMLAFAIIAVSFFFLLNPDVEKMIVTLISFAVLTTMSYLMYISGQWGGGDVKTMAALSILMGPLKGDVFPFFLNFLINMFFAGAIYGIVMTLHRGIEKRDVLKKEITKKDVVLTILILSFIPFAFLIKFEVVRNLTLFTIPLIASIPWIKTIENKCMIEEVKVRDLTEGDWLAEEIKKNKKIVVPQRKIGLTKEDIEKIKELKIKKVKVKTGFPFVPVFLLAYIFTIAFGNFVFLLI